jgi:SAM-dependent methyltransferase
MTDTVKIIKDFYDNSVMVEWERLQRHQFEFELTTRYINRYIKPGDKVLDIGGGPGRYSLYLAAKGCDVTLFDLSSANVEFAKEQAAAQSVSFRTIVGDAREVDSLVSEQYDHILLMGPLYHLLQEADRVKAINASLKCLKPNGKIYVSFISSYGGIIYSMKYEPQLIIEEDLEFQYKLFEDDLPFSGDSFTKSYFFRHKDVLPFMAQFPLEKLHFFGQESILAPCEENIKAQPQEVINKWLDLAEKVCEREDLLSYSEHLMYIGRKV